VPALFSGDHRGSPLRILTKLNHYRRAAAAIVTKDAEVKPSQRKIHVSRKGAKTQRTNIRSTKAAPRTEARNSKQIQMFKKQKISNNFNLDSAFWIFFGFGFIWPRFVSDFVLRILDLFRWLLGKINIPGFVLFNSSEVGNQMSGLPVADATGGWYGSPQPCRNKVKSEKRRKLRWRKSWKKN